MKDLRKTRGAAAESDAAAWLEAKGFEVLKRNWKIPSRSGETLVEVDLLARGAGAYWIVEVKSARCQGHEVARLLGEDQRKRLYLAASAISRGRPGLVRVALVWAKEGEGRARHFEWLADP
jgi:Holliday junction resolvase-like predicted endonuclease